MTESTITAEAAETAAKDAATADFAAKFGSHLHEQR